MSAGGNARAPLAVAAQLPRAHGARSGSGLRPRVAPPGASHWTGGTCRTPPPTLTVQLRQTPSATTAWSLGGSGCARAPPPCSAVASAPQARACLLRAGSAPPGAPAHPAPPHLAPALVRCAWQATTPSGHLTTMATLSLSSMTPPGRPSCLSLAPPAARCRKRCARVCVCVRTCATCSCSRHRAPGARQGDAPQAQTRCAPCCAGAVPAPWVPAGLADAPPLAPCYMFHSLQALIYDRFEVAYHHPKPVDTNYEVTRGLLAGMGERVRPPRELGW